jgi:hypothetical protein
MSRGGPWALSGLGAAALIAAGSGCMSATRELAREQTRREAHWKDLVSAPPPAEIPSLNWNTALDRLRHHNPKLGAADLDVRRAEEALSQVKKSLIPTANFQAGYNRVLGNSGGLTFEPFTFAATFLFDVPGLFNYRTRYEAAVLYLTRARLARETLWRTEVIELYRLHLENRDLSAEEHRLDETRRAQAQLALSSPRAAESVAGRLGAAQTQWSARRQDWQARLGELLGMSGVPVTFSGAGLPALPYEAPASRPAPETLARLPMRIAALELVSLRARQLGIRLEQLPEVDLTVDSPTIYQSGSGQGSIWSAHEVLVGVNAFWTLDTQGRQRSESRLLTAELTFRREVLEQEAVAAAAKMRAALDGLARTDRSMAAVHRALPDSPDAWRSPLHEAGEALSATRRDWQCVLWFFDDAQWTGLPV